jgi:hypothetical protein
LPVGEIKNLRRQELRLRALIKKWTLWAPLLLGAVLSAAGILTSHSFQRCIADSERGFGPVLVLEKGFRCSGSFVLDYSTGITAIAVTIIASIMFVLWVYVSDVLKTTAMQSELIRHSVELTRAALVTTYPPSLVFRGFSLVERTFGENQKIQVNFTVTNKGATTATITETGMAVLVVHPAQIPGEVAFARRAVTNVALRSGEASHWPIAAATALTAQEANALWQGTVKVICLGYFTYRDDFGTVRNTGFCREYDLARRRWSVVNDPDYEYAY